MRYAFSVAQLIERLRTYPPDSQVIIELKTDAETIRYEVLTDWAVDTRFSGSGVIIANTYRMG